MRICKNPFTKRIKLSVQQSYLKEAEIITRYLLKESPGENEKKLYSKAMEELKIELSEEEKRTWDFMIKYPFSFGPLDSALAIKMPEGNIRKKVFVMLAILETSKSFTPYFLSKKYSFFDTAGLIFTGIRSLFRLLAGLILITFL